MSEEARHRTILAARDRVGEAFHPNDRRRGLKEAQDLSVYDLLELDTEIVKGTLLEYDVEDIVLPRYRR